MKKIVYGIIALTIVISAALVLNAQSNVTEKAPKAQKVEKKMDCKTECADKATTACCAKAKAACTDEAKAACTAETKAACTDAAKATCTDAAKATCTDEAKKDCAMKAEQPAKACCAKSAEVKK